MVPGLTLYRKFCKKHPQLPVYLQAAWLEAAAGGSEWGIALVEKGGEVVAAQPWFLKRKWGQSLCYQPFLVPYLGPWIVYPEGQKVSTRLSWEKELMSKLIRQLPPYGMFVQSFRPEVANWLPYFWAGFHQSTRYTYRLALDKTEDELFAGLTESMRRQVKKGGKNTRVQETGLLETVYRLKELAYLATGKRFHIPLSYARDIFSVADAAGRSRVLEARDEDGNLHAALWLSWDAHCTYYLMGASHPEHKNSGAMSLLMWEAIRQARNTSRYFDFEGSMIEPVERFFRGFGAEQVSYFEVSRITSPVMRLWKKWKKI